jgi:alpha-beta hydrolase superfamily lysophospholipase
MRSAFVIDIETPKKFLLNGLWFGPKKAKRVVIVLHGLTGSVFGLANTVQELIKADRQMAVITFNNRGFKSVTDIKQAVGKGKWKTVGSAHEVFTECVDDIQGAINFAKKQGVKEIYLAGHSTGCQKAMYWASKTNGKGVKGIILLAPLSDYAGALHDDTKGRMKKATALARKLVAGKKPHELLPEWASSMRVDAQRYLSLYTPDSIEEIFSYAQPDRNPRIYASVRLPVFAFFGAEDQYADRPAAEIEKWFARHTRSRKFRSAIMPGANHGFRGKERLVAKKISEWISA